MKSNRRDFLKKSSLLGLAGLASNLLGNGAARAAEQAGELLGSNTAFQQLPLPYAFNALEPYIDQLTMEIHYSKHHKGYVDKLNSADTSSINFELDDAGKCGQVDAATPAVIRNNLGGHYNHSLFWTLLRPATTGTPNLPEGQLATALAAGFGSFDDFKKAFSDAALKVFGSGWCWLIVKDGKLKICTTPNQDNPLMKVAAEQGRIVLALDVWEHAYYLKHQNKRADYIAAWWQVINWQKAEALFSVG